MHTHAYIRHNFFENIRPDWDWNKQIKKLKNYFVDFQSVIKKFKKKLKKFPRKISSKPKKLRFINALIRKGENLLNYIKLL